MNDEDFSSAINRVMMRAGLYTRSPRYRYYSRNGSKDRYFYTTERTKHLGHLRFVAGIYRHIKTRNQWKLVKRVGFARRYKADAWALAMRDREQAVKS